MGTVREGFWRACVVISNHGLENDLHRAQIVALSALDNDKFTTKGSILAACAVFLYGMTNF
jgi:hypothetical protein